MLRRVLLIDDDRAQFRLTEAQLKHVTHGQYALDWTPRYDEGLAKLLTGAYAVCLLDYQLGERDGLQLIREAVANGCHTPIVFLTAETSPQIDVEAMNAGAVDYLVKGEITPRLLERSLRYAVKLAASLDRLRELATIDELTGLLNRREFDRILHDEEERARRFHVPLSLLLVDVDHFKAVNDAYGHPAGDAVLREIARRLRAGVRDVDRVARFGGEEFAIVLVQADIAAAVDSAEHLRRSIGGGPIAVPPGGPVAVTASVGVASLPAHADSAGALVSAADRALYAAKAAGRNRVACA